MSAVSPGVIRQLRTGEAAGLPASARNSPRPGAPLVVEVEVTAADAGTIPPTHTAAMLDYDGEQIEGAVINSVPAFGRGSIAVGTKLAAMRLADGRWFLVAGGGGASSSTGLVPPHSHLGGADGPYLGIVGTV